MTAPENLKLAQHLDRIQAAFERGQYRQVLEHIHQAQSRYPQSGRLRLWQALAQEAIGQTQEAILLAQTLLHNPDPEVAQQARYVLGIWQAPRLRRPAEWLSQIPDLSHLEERDLSEYRWAPGRPHRQSSPSQSTRADGALSRDPFSPSAANSLSATQPLIWALIGLFSAVLAVMAWLP